MKEALHQALLDNNMADISIILTYKSKVLLFSKEVLLDPAQNKWDFLKISNTKKGKALTYVKEEIILGNGIKQNEIVLTPFNNSEENPSVYYIKMTDGNVNSIKRKKGWRLEFYRINEIPSISLSEDASQIFEKYEEQIKNILSE